MSLQCRMCRRDTLEIILTPPGSHDWIAKCHHCLAMFLVPKEPYYPTMESLKRAFAYVDPIPGEEHDFHRFD